MNALYYSIRHVTRFRYASAVRESVMELVMQPRTEGPQRLQSFQINLKPRAQLFAYTDHLGNAVYHFNVLKDHGELLIEAESRVEMQPHLRLPDAVDASAWDALDMHRLDDEAFAMLTAHGLAHTNGMLDDFIAEKRLAPEADPLTTLRRLNGAIYEAFEYDAAATDVDTPIAEAIEKRKGVCQDFSHVMIAVCRKWGIPARYVSGYLHTSREKGDRSTPDATHAWIEAFVPGLGWVGFDPTNNAIAAERHIRVAIGRDYVDVPPTRGLYKGQATSELALAVSVTQSQGNARFEDFLRVARPMRPVASTEAAERDFHQQQQQQQQSQQQAQQQQ